jgi:HK97 gp10 family phage protein
MAATPLPVFLLELTVSQAALNPVTERITNKFGDRVVADGIKNAPRLTGSLRNSIKRQPALGGKGVASINITAGGPSNPHDVDYAVYVHDGTARMAPRPFLRNAFNANLPKFEKELADVMELLHAGRPERVSGRL